MLDIVAYGAHPDDLELAAGGTLALHCLKGYKVVGVDMTAGEMSANGTPVIRREEALRAGEIIGLQARLNLGLPDLGVRVEEEQVRIVVESIRKLKPRIILTQYWESHHPDHENTGLLLTKAFFLASLAKYRTDSPPHQANAIYYYDLPPYVRPGFIVNITDVYDVKMEALRAHASQFSLQAGSVPTQLNQADFLTGIKARDAQWGWRSSCTYGEAFYSKKIPAYKLLPG